MSEKEKDNVAVGGSGSSESGMALWRKNLQGKYPERVFGSDDDYADASREGYDALKAKLSVQAKSNSDLMQRVLDNPSALETLQGLFDEDDEVYQRVRSEREQYESDRAARAAETDAFVRAMQADESKVNEWRDARSYDDARISHLVEDVLIKGILEKYRTEGLSSVLDILDMIDNRDRDVAAAEAAGSLKMRNAKIDEVRSKRSPEGVLPVLSDKSTGRGGSEPQPYSNPFRRVK
jgi:hypothetical protein